MPMPVRSLMRPKLGLAEFIRFGLEKSLRRFRLVLLGDTLARSQTADTGATASAIATLQLRFSMIGETEMQTQVSDLPKLQPRSVWGPARMFAPSAFSLGRC